ncbi:MAG TPA: isocitrate lyase/phosphoenolpyruvate mutase family protein [Candidatus Binatia bacterium]|jgi:2-methylisocitrate lyase-like PEP mutase family enzyme
MSNSTQAAKAQRFAALHREDGIIVLPNCWDVGSACVLAAAGFRAIATTSGGCAFSLGYCDGETPRFEMLAAVKRIAQAVAIPVSADMEAGYGKSPEEVAETVRLTIEAGAVGINIEDGDKSGPRRLFDFDLSVARIQAAVEAAKASGMEIVINARTDGYMIGNSDTVFEETVRRANAYLDAGAGSAFVMGARDGELIARLVKAIHGPLNILAGPGTRRWPSLPKWASSGLRSAPTSPRRRSHWSGARPRSCPVPVPTASQNAPLPSRRFTASCAANKRPFQYTPGIPSARCT